MSSISFGGDCPFIHDDIDVLYGVPVTPIEELPKTCTCGEPFTYADEVCFVAVGEVTYDPPNIKVEGAVTFEQRVVVPAAEEPRDG